MLSLCLLQRRCEIPIKGKQECKIYGKVFCKNNGGKYMTKDELTKEIAKKGQAFAIELFKDCDKIDKETLKLVMTAYIAGATDMASLEGLL